MMMEAIYKISDEEFRVRLHRLFEVIDMTNAMIKSSEKTNDQLGVRQYQYMKNKFVKELAELLASDFAIPVQLKNVA